MNTGRFNIANIDMPDDRKTYDTVLILSDKSQATGFFKTYLRFQDFKPMERIYMKSIFCHAEKISLFSASDNIKTAWITDAHYPIKWAKYLLSKAFMTTFSRLNISAPHCGAWPWQWQMPSACQPPAHSIRFAPVLGV
jgi:hypothetical protein